ncbi:MULTISPECIES: adenylosuccinate lyase [unclassified Lentimicrobium]|uniref:adenylosuccinate lyase n=1 Tax=unclassified Lentimicrobium TaxID=2677434 RepID=UPI00155526FE|nr:MULTISPECIES: adenylosuccinate lyase [unclassified Lentimicrobium]NPD44553.1 adenylosuccinate lyase [Lentimicrobium sp. S6]NPD85630.1 adenylosuccinate lyase [Lentimicrobium sp. L6]
MELTALNAISPIDGRYRSKTEKLGEYFSEEGLIKYRVQVEVEYFISLCEIPLPQLKDFNSNLFKDLRLIYEAFKSSDALRIKDIESITNHDVKAVEYFLKEKFDALNLSQYKEFIHFGLTSQDINNTATPLSLKLGFEAVIMPALNELRELLMSRANDWKNIPMLARTHGQAASPTSLGKEIYVFVERLDNQFKMLEQIPYAAKFGGATGNFNAHHVAYPQINWVEFGNKFVAEKLGLSRLQNTTQIEHYDYMAAFFDNLKRINNIMMDLDRDIWTYVSMDYFKQKIKKGEVGSSAMPHKVNPIDFENSEGNIGLANAIMEHLAAKLPVSRLQRDLTDSTVTRNLGVPLGHMIIAILSLQKGLGKLILNEAKLAADLENNWPVVAEAIQTILRRENYPNPYEALKDLTRTNEKINAESIAVFVENLEVSDAVKEELKRITPSNYTGIINF